ncbi:MAG: cytochrome C [Burkholderiales bacterium]
MRRRAFTLLFAALAVWAAPTPALAQTLEGVLMPGQVIEGHAKWENDCRKCHVPFDKSAQEGLCKDCHRKIAADIRDHTRYHGRLSKTNCRSCHTDHKGRKADITRLDPNTFDHDETSYPLKGGHRKVALKCAACHKAGAKYRDAPLVCNACHKKNDVHKTALGPKCEQCHEVDSWKKTSFDHDKTRFRLELGHRGVECNKCHVDQRFKDTPLACASCHKKDDDAKGHKGRFGTKCDTCHTVSKWNDVKFDHDRDTRFVLRGKHERTKCDACHTTPLYTTKTPGACVACHKKDDDLKGHRGSLGDKCGSCHNESNWREAKFDHDKTDFPLTGKHTKARCESCHTAGVTAGAGKAREKLPTQCVACHRQDDRKKGHKGKFGDKCETCHSAKNWKDIAFDHDRDTKYPLRGKHAKATCASCHTGSLYRDKLATDCYACHRSDDDRKGHKGKLGTRCEACHTADGWKVKTFDHNRSRFPLTGSHVRVECGKCHSGLAFKDAPTDCDGCHRKDDVHKRRLGADCGTCHNTRIWQSWDYDHAKTGFALDGGHRKVDCYACHSTPMKKGSPAPVRSCFACHAKDDVHRGAFGPACDRCHVTSTWPAVFSR